jgi:hypothetical protein
VRFQVLTAASMKMAVFWVVGPWSLVEVYRCFRGASITLMMGAASTSETSVKFYQTTRCNNPEDSHLHACLVFIIYHIIRQIFSKNLNHNQVTFKILIHAYVSRPICNAYILIRLF